MSNSKAIVAKDKISKIYLSMGLIFIGLFTTISLCGWFLSALNF